MKWYRENKFSFIDLIIVSTLANIINGLAKHIFN